MITFRFEEFNADLGLILCKYNQLQAKYLIFASPNSRTLEIVVGKKYQPAYISWNQIYAFHDTYPPNES